MGILDGIVEWIAEQFMHELDLISTSVLGALGCDMSTFLRYFPDAETMYNIFVALAIGLILLNWVWQLFKNAVKNATGAKDGGLSGAAYDSSVNKGGGFANRVIGNVATGTISTTGSISGEKAPDALMSYMGYTALGEGAADVPSFSNVEIGGGRITATETSAEHPEGIPMAMYHTYKYAAPEGDYTTVTAADGTSWYKQYAVDAVERTPYKAPDGAIAYHEVMIKKVPKAPPRKDKL